MKMRICQITGFILLTALFSMSCRTEFEKVRQSQDPQVIYENANKYYQEEAYLKAQTLYQLILNSFRGTEQAEILYYNYAYTYYHMRNYIQAAYYFETFANTFIRSDKREEAEYMKGYCYYLLSPNHRLDQEYTQKAIDQFQLFINTYPESEKVDECNNLIDECRKKLEVKLYAQGKLYYDLKSYDAAIHTFENLLRDFPETENAEEVRFLILKAAYQFAINSFVERQKERYEETIERYGEFIKKFPESTYLNEANTMLSQSQNELKTL